MIPILQRYVLKELFRALIIAFTVLILVMCLGVAIQLLYRGLDIIRLRAMIPFMILNAVPYALPAAALTAAVMSYGRLAADNELMAIATSGIHLRTVVTPVILMGILFSGIALVLNAELLPRSAFHMKIMREKAATELLREFIHDSGEKTISVHPFAIHIAKQEEGVSKHIIIFRCVEKFATEITIAREGEIVINTDDNSATLRLKGVSVDAVDQRRGGTGTTGTVKETISKIPLGRDFQTRYKMQHLPLMALLKESASLTRAVQAHEQKLDDPKRVAKDAWKERQRTEVEAQKVSAKRQAVMSERARIQETLARSKERVSKAQLDASSFSTQADQAEAMLQRLERQRDDLAAKSQKEGGDAAKALADVEKQIADTKKSLAEAKRNAALSQQEIETGRKAQQEGMLVLAMVEANLANLTRQGEEMSAKLSHLERLVNEAEKQRMAFDVRVEIHKRLAMSASCFVFVLIGIPLGVRTRRSNLMVGFGVSFAIILLLYYPLTLAGQVMASDRRLPVAPSLWGANVVIMIIGVALLRRVFRR